MDNELGYVCVTNEAFGKRYNMADVTDEVSMLMVFVKATPLSQADGFYRLSIWLQLWLDQRLLAREGVQMQRNVATF